MSNQYVLMLSKLSYNGSICRISVNCSCCKSTTLLQRFWIIRLLQILLLLLLLLHSWPSKPLFSYPYPSRSWNPDFVLLSLLPINIAPQYETICSNTIKYENFHFY